MARRDGIRVGVDEFHLVPLLLLLSTTITLAADFNDLPTSQWFKSLQLPLEGRLINCCDQSDCRVTPARPVAGNGWQAFIAGRWWDVPGERIFRDRNSVFEDSVACYNLPTSGTQEPRWFCFVPPLLAG